MTQTVAHLVDHIIPRVPVRQWVLSLPIPFRHLLAAHPRLLTPVLQVIHRAISTFLIKQARLKRIEVQTSAITLIQRFSSAVSLLKQVLDIDIEHCSHCGGALKIIAAILEKAAIIKILDHLGLPA